MTVFADSDDVREPRKGGELVVEQTWDEGPGYAMPSCELFVVAFRKLLLQANLVEVLAPAVEAFSAEDESVHMCGIRGGTQPHGVVEVDMGEWAGTWRFGDEDLICFSHREE